MFLTTSRCLALLAVLGADRVSAQVAEPIVYDVDGTRVVQRVLPGHDVVSVNVYLLGGARQLTPETAGIEALVLRVSERGTTGFPGDALREEQVATGGRFFVRVEADWSVLGFTGLADEFDRSFAVLADRIVRPTLEPAAIDIERNRALLSARSVSDDPEEAARRLAEGQAYEGHPYAVDVNGTEASLGTLTADRLKAYHTAQFVRSRMLVSVVGAVDRAAVEAAIRAALAPLPVGTYEWAAPPLWTRPAPRSTFEERTLPTNHAVGYFGGPASDHEDYPAFQIAVSILSGYVSGMIREQGLSYSAGASFVDRAASGGAIYLTTVQPERSFRIINDVIANFRGAIIQRAALREFAEGSALEYYLSNQTTAQQAEFQASSLLLRGQPQTVASWVENLRSVSGSEIRTVFREYIGNIQYSFIGRTGLAPRELMREY